MTVEFTLEQFWQLVESVNWAQLSTRENSHSTAVDPCDIGKARLLEKLPTMAHLDAFRMHYSRFHNDLYARFDSWASEAEGTREVGYEQVRDFGLGDDSFGDLIDHIIGLGQAEVSACMENPHKALQRALDFDFLESFAYCIPYREDYDPTNLKLAREEDGLRHWKQMVSEGVGYALKEVMTRSEACEKLRAQLESEGGIPLTAEQYQEHVAREERRSRLMSDLFYARSQVKRFQQADYLSWERAEKDRKHYEEEVVRLENAIKSGNY